MIGILRSMSMISCEHNDIVALDQDQQRKSTKVKQTLLEIVKATLASRNSTVHVAENDQIDHCNWKMPVDLQLRVVNGALLPSLLFAQQKLLHDLKLLEELAERF